MILDFISILDTICRFLSPGFLLRWKTQILKWEGGKGFWQTSSHAATLVFLQRKEEQDQDQIFELPHDSKDIDPVGKIRRQKLQHSITTQFSQLCS